MSRMRHTMGQDWGGRYKTNPDKCPRVSRKEVEEAAKQAGVKVRRDLGGWCMWWIKRPGDEWRTFASTNYLALESLKDIKP